MKYEDIPSRLGISIDGLTTWSKLVTKGAQDDGTSSLKHGFARSIDIGTSQRIGFTNDDHVLARSIRYQASRIPATTSTLAGEEVEGTSFLEDVAGFNGIAAWETTSDVGSW